MIREICQGNKLVMINNLYTSLNSEDDMVKLTSGVLRTDCFYGETECWGIVKLIDALVKMTDGFFLWE